MHHQARIPKRAVLPGNCPDKGHGEHDEDHEKIRTHPGLVVSLILLAPFSIHRGNAQDLSGLLLGCWEGHLVSVVNVEDNRTNLRHADREVQNRDVPRPKPNRRA
jgi:hypothetical protein